MSGKDSRRSDDQGKKKRRTVLDVRGVSNPKKGFIPLKGFSQPESRAHAFQQRIRAAKSVKEAVEIQSQYAKKAYDTYVAELSKLGEMYVGLARDAYKPVDETDEPINKGFAKKREAGRRWSSRRDAALRSATKEPGNANRFLSSRKDVEEFAAAARDYVKVHAKDKKTALAALQRMGIVTATGQLTKRYS
jgi:hypothetical protein